MEISKEIAIVIAQTFLIKQQQIFISRGHEAPWIFPNSNLEYEFGWVFPWDAKSVVLGLEESQALGNIPIFVDKYDLEVFTLPVTSMTPIRHTRAYLYQYALNKGYKVTYDSIPDYFGNDAEWNDEDFS